MITICEEFDDLKQLDFDAQCQYSVSLTVV